MYTKRRQEQTESENEIFKEGNKKHQLFLCEAAEIAKLSNMNQKHGAIVVYKNKIIASGYNYTCNHLNDKYSIHAEVSAISQMFYNKKLLELCDIYVVRISPAFDCLRNSKPCKTCSNFIKKYNLKNIYYSTSYE